MSALAEAKATRAAVARALTMSCGMARSDAARSVRARLVATLHELDDECAHLAYAAAHPLHARHTDECIARQADFAPCECRPPAAAETMRPTPAELALSRGES